MQRFTPIRASQPGKRCRFPVWESEPSIAGFFVRLRRCNEESGFPSVRAFQWFCFCCPFQTGPPAGRWWRGMGGMRSSGPSGGPGAWARAGLPGPLELVKPDDNLTAADSSFLVSSSGEEFTALQPPQFAQPSSMLRSASRTGPLAMYWTSHASLSQEAFSYAALWREVARSVRSLSLTALDIGRRREPVALGPDRSCFCIRTCPTSVLRRTTLDLRDTPAA